jgi:hypothetical protein
MMPAKEISDDEHGHVAQDRHEEVVDQAGLEGFVVVAGEDGRGSPAFDFPPFLSS